VRIESPVPDWMVPKVWEWMNKFREFMVDDQCPKTLAAFTSKHSGDLLTGSLEYAFIADDGTPLGAVWAEKIQGQYFGHLVFEREILTPSQKFSYTQHALQLMFDSGVKKVIWLSLVSNRPFNIFLRKLRAEKKDLIPDGAVCEGKPVPVQVFISESVER
jgi:hypothetical protein